MHNPYAYIPASITYFVYTHGRNGCLVRDSLPITMPFYALSMSPNDTSICVGDRVQLHTAAASTQGPVTYQWYENGEPGAPSLSCNDCADPFAIPAAGETTYTVVFTDNGSCPDTQSVTVHAWALPVVQILNKDTTIKYGGHLQLMVTGAYQYTWAPPGSLTDPNIQNPVASPTEPTEYIVYGTDKHHFASFDTLHVGIDNRDKLIIPSGFTPNDDGRNDVFKVVNLTFQKILEFRVFNRWGQEIFSTTDGARGWDGTWKGISREVGTYPYLIRIRYPDGFVESYKGNVILIR